MTDIVPQLLTNDELKAALEKSPSPNRITPEYLKSRIADVKFMGPEQTDGTLTLCIVTLDNGFKFNGSSACADPANYNKEIGKKIAYDNAFREMWPCFGFLLKETLYLKNPTVATSDIPTASSGGATEMPKADTSVIHNTLAFFASCIKSGENWTQACETEFTKAKAELAKL